jgi:hypothetical protein
MESCFTTDETYDGCEAGDDVTNSGLPLGPGEGEVDVTAEGDDNYTIVALSKSGTSFSYDKAGATVTKDCSDHGAGGCPADGAW